MVEVKGAGRALAERLGLKIVGTEGHDLKCGCPFCQSSDAGRIHADTGVYYCFACQKALNAFDLCKVTLGDHKAAIDTMVGVGLFEPPAGNGNAGSKPPTAAPAKGDEAGFLEVCRLKRVPPEAWRKFGAKPHKGGVTIPMMGPDRKACSAIHITPANGKGLYCKGKPTGLFLPGQFPAVGESWLIVEGPKDAAALHAIGYLAAGLPSNHLKADFAPLFKGVNVTIVPDADRPGWEGAKKTAEVLKGHAASIRVARLPVEIEG